MDIELFKFFLALLLAAITGLVTYFWGRRRSREKDLFLLWRNTFDRPAFRGSYMHHSKHEKFQKAISITLKAIATGKLFDGGGAELSRVEGIYHGPSQIRNIARKKTIIDVQNRLQKILRLSYSQPPDIVQMDYERNEIIGSLNKIWEKLGIEIMDLPTNFKEPENIPPGLLNEIENEFL